MAERRAPAGRLVVVAGMHRAGTSVVARGLIALGIDFGDALMSADVRMNARGFFEDVDVVALDDALLAAHGADWKSSALLDRVDWSAAPHAAQRAAAQALLAARSARTGSYGFKDPRAPRLLPFWQGAAAAAGLADGYVVAVRHPQAVVDSLAVRDGLDPWRSALLWLTHMACALRYTQGRPCVVVDYDRMLADPARELDRIAAGLGLPSPSPADVADYAGGFLAAELRHAQYARDRLDAAGWPPGVAELHDLVQRLAADEDDPRAPATAARVGESWERLAGWSPLLDYTARVERGADEVPRLAAELAWARESLASADAYSRDLRSRLDESQRYSADLKTHLDRKEGELRHAHGVLERLRERAVGRMLLRDIQRRG